jgi:hypothetical protein
MKAWEVKRAKQCKGDSRNRDGQGCSDFRAEQGFDAEPKQIHVFPYMFQKWMSANAFQKHPRSINGDFAALLHLRACTNVTIPTFARS